jgi:N-carbamoyl-L-amino-acid hydrolase
VDVDAERTVAELEELHGLTGDPETGARRVAWSEDWRRAREWLRDRLAELPVSVEVDEAGNLWALLRGESERTVAVGSHLDSVPGGGAFDGALGVLGALAVLRSAAAGSAPPRTLALVDWVDEEGRFGRSLYGSAAAAGTLELDAARALTDADGRRLPDVLREQGIELERVHEAGARLRGLDAYLELHIEQGPVLEARGEAVAAVTGTAGVERHRLRFTGRGGHAGTVPMERRRDPLGAAAATALAIPEIARRHGGVGTVGAIEAHPGIPTAVPGTVDVWLDQRHHEAGPLAAMLLEAREAAHAAAGERGIELIIEPVWSIEPIPFDAELIAHAREAAGGGEPLPSGALHDAAEVARAGVPTVMLFVQSRGGVSHAPDEWSAPEHVAAGVRALARVADQALSAG